MRGILQMNHYGFYRDEIYCASPNCKNKCGRKMSPEIEYLLKQDKYRRASYAYFCGEPEEVSEELKEIT